MKTTRLSFFLPSHILYYWHVCGLTNIVVFLWHYDQDTTKHLSDASFPVNWCSDTIVNITDYVTVDEIKLSCQNNDNLLHIYCSTRERNVPHWKIMKSYIIIYILLIYMEKIIICIFCTLSLRTFICKFVYAEEHYHILHMQTKRRSIIFSFVK